MNRMMLRFSPVLVALWLLAACVPGANDAPRIQLEQLSEPVSYYPHETGAAWQYLPNNARIDEARLLQVVEGPTVIEGDIWTATHLLGRGLDVRSFRRYTPEGVFLLREDRPGTQITFDPPIQEMPAEGQLRVGLTWAGETRAQLFFPEAQPENQRSDLMVSYRYTVVDSRTVTVQAGAFDIFVLNFITRTFGEEGDIVEELTQEIWFSPFVGEVRTENGFFLVAANFLDDPAAETSE